MSPPAVFLHRETSPPGLPTLPSALWRSQLTYYLLGTNFSPESVLQTPFSQVTSTTWLPRDHVLGSLALGVPWTPLAGGQSAENDACKGIKSNTQSDKRSQLHRDAVIRIFFFFWKRIWDMVTPVLFCRHVSQQDPVVGLTSSDFRDRNTILRKLRPLWRDVEISDFCWGYHHRSC